MPVPSAPATVTLSVAVMTHPARAAQAEKLAAELQDCSVRVIQDPAPERGPATMRTARAAWAAVGQDATHHLVLQDDVMPAPGLLDAVRRAAGARPEHALAFFAEWGSRSATPIRIAALCGSAWAEVVDFYIPAQALVLPAAVARAADGYLATQDEDTPDDIALHGYLHGAGVPIWVSVPNLVEHADTPSLIGNQVLGLRRSACHLPDVGSARDLADPQGDAVTGLLAIPYFSWWDKAALCFTREGPTAAQWQQRPGRDVQDAYGIDDTVVDAAFEHQCGRFPAQRWSELTALVDKAKLRDLWTVAFSTGLLAGVHRPGLDEAATTSIPAQAALGSLAPGALRTVVSPERDGWVYSLLAPFVEAATRHGIAQARTVVAP